MRIIRAKGEQRRLVGEDGEFQGMIEAENWALNVEREKSKSQREKEYMIFVKNCDITKKDHSLTCICIKDNKNVIIIAYFSNDIAYYRFDLSPPRFA